MILEQEQDIYVQFLGGASEVGATCIYIYWKGKKILIDSGKRRGFGHLYPIFDEIEKDIDLFILTHVHQDHIGSFMEVLEALEIKKILTSKENKEILRFVLKDTKKIINSSKKIDKEIKKLYSNENIEKAIERAETLDYGKKISLGDLNIIFYETSHLLGSLGMFFESEEYKLLITSDFTESQKFFHPKTSFLKNLSGQDIDTIITETTYGNDLEGDEILKDKCLNELATAINSIFKEEGNILIPCFAVGRMQEVILAILKLIASEKIDKDTLIYMPYHMNDKTKEIINLGGNITSKYFQQYFDILAEELKVGEEDYLTAFREKIKKEKELELNKVINIEEINILDEIMSRKFLNIRKFNDLSYDFDTKKKGIFLIQPGMLASLNTTNENFQKSSNLALDIMNGDRDGIIFVGYQAAGTVGEKIKNSEYNQVIEVFGEKYTKKNKNIYSVSFPGHVSIRGVQNLVEKLKPENIILVHGDIKASKNIATVLKDKNLLIPEIDEKIYLIDNKEKIFFSMQHKFSKIIIDLDSEYLLENKTDNILKDKKYEDYKIINLLKKEDLRKIDRNLLVIEFIVKNKKSIDFYKKLQEELKTLNISSNLNIIKDKKEDENLLENISKLISDTNEKTTLYVLDAPFEMTQDFVFLAQLGNIKTYFYNEGELEKILNFPFDIETEIDIDLKDKIELEQLIEKLKYYRGKISKRKLKKVEKYKQRPKYNINLEIYNKNIFYFEDKSLWGEIDSLLDIKNKGIIKDLENLYVIFDKYFNNKLEKIQFTNYEYSYSENKEYREFIDFDKNKIYGKYHLENGVQFFEIILKNNFIAEDFRDKVELCVDL